ncbi:hypothetical protein [Oceanidesulfovibrio marinus]|uniref:Secreted protein n=1 Tax=Oceanidesulfovibrio marinus TaxID=370038 RepID=A0A6P1ZHN1_9BACT|nr:hypothetical protein [Oceanidesulfovibrio marinus]QJT07405.1 hypothetical protein E8L03_00075 [Oceanidesulfovibrio marinus]TVM34679.1 hypothetical protein DQK91_08915 [Oceanidesulfovibrio marinus]
MKRKLLIRRGAACGVRLLLAFALVLVALSTASAQNATDSSPARRFDLPTGPIVREVPPIDRIEHPERAAETESDGKNEWEELWERNATPGAEEIQRFKERQQELERETNATNRTQGSSGGYYREPAPSSGGTIRRRTYYPYLKNGELHRLPRDTYEPYP